MQTNDAKAAFLIAVIIVFGQLTGCATIVKGTTQQIPVASDPPGAEVTADGQLIGQAPVTVTLERKRDHLITVSKEGYSQKSIAITKSTGGAVWGNLLAGGLIGWGIDATSGAQYNLSPESISVQLTPVGGSNDSQPVADTKSDFIRQLNDLDVLKEQSKISEEEYSAMRTSLFKRYYPDMDAELDGDPDKSAASTGNPSPTPTDPSHGH